MELDEEVMLAGEAWLSTLRDQLGRASVAKLTTLINDLITIAVINTALAQPPRSTSPASENAPDK